MEGKSRLIVANEVIQNAADNGCLIPMTEAAKANTGRKPRRVLADAGYRSEDGFQELAEKKITAYVALGREGKTAKKLLPCAENPHTQAMEHRRNSEPGQRWY